MEDNKICISCYQDLTNRTDYTELPIHIKGKLKTVYTCNSCKSEYQKKMENWRIQDWINKFIGEK